MEKGASTVAPAAAEDCSLRFRGTWIRAAARVEHAGTKARINVVMRAVLSHSSLFILSHSWHVHHSDEHKQGKASIALLSPRRRKRVARAHNLSFRIFVKGNFNRLILGEQVDIILSV